MLVRRFRALTSDVEVEADGAELAALLGDLVATYPDASGEPSMRYRVGAGQVVRGGTLVCACDHPLDAAAAFELDLYQQAVGACQDGIVLHASAVALPGGAVVLTGPSGAGKTTLALELIGRGADYMTEECALLRSDGTVLGLARPITRLPDDDGAAPSGLVPREIRRRLTDGRVVRRTLLLPPRERIRATAAPLGVVVALARDAGRETVTRRLPGVEAIAVLQKMSLNHGPGALAGIVAAAGKVPVHRVRSGSVTEAVASIEALLPPVREVHHHRELK